ncbi:MAG: hypothetical protein EI684_07605 [Candidatus Viridilinea halotolerans]|uniref:3-keto-alpha-glucoside-1,2-lyase/3-keto-2-hydroxy-glucal hydratase domain-containing protein n=1 Tax=Candidatus Viridilinea halotolerans TaxID=2491704 RepID=A0A426U334_9CHLR|nr:MAG: hypothetical protein EI684_07605 [Candidatus Viridilinea halotolerans]
MKPNSQRRTTSTLVAGIAGFMLVLLVALGLNLSAFQGQGQAQQDSPLFPMPDYTATPTIAPSPTAQPILVTDVLLQPDLSDASALDAWVFVDVGVVLAEERSVWQIEEGTLLQNRTAAAGNPNTYETMAFLGDPSWADYTVRARFYDQGNGNAGLVVRREGMNFYRLRLLASMYSDTPKLILEKVIEGEATRLASHDAPGYDLHMWHDMSLRVQGSLLTATLDGVVIFEAEDTTLTSGQPGLFTRAMGQIRFSDVVVTN